MQLVMAEMRAGADKVGVGVVEAVGEKPPFVHDSHPLMIVDGVVDGRQCRDVLIDGGASSNFVSGSWAVKQRLRIERLSHPVEVVLANRGSVHITQVVCVREMRVLGSTAQCKLLVLDPLSHDVVLGAHWLHAARVTIDYGRGTWNGVPVPDVKAHSDSSRVNMLDIAQSEEQQRVTSEVQCGAMAVAPEHQRRMDAILSRVGSVFSKELSKGGVAKIGKAVRCEVVLKDLRCRPVADRQRPRSPKDTDTLIAFTREMEAAGLIAPSKSAWRAQAVLVKKYRDGVELDEKRPCWDYRRVNHLVHIDSFPMPLAEDLMDKLSGSRLFSKIDLLKGFWQIPMDPTTRQVLAFSTPLGLYEPLFMPFGFCNAPSVFQREMQRVLAERLMKGVVVFVDDILIYTRTVEEHAVLVEWVLTRLRDEGYIAHPDKCEFFQREVSFLGHVVNERGLAVQQHKVEAVQRWPVPKSKKDVRAFLGLTGYYRKFIEGYGRLAIPLTELTKDDMVFAWGAKEQAAFDALKDRLTRAPVLAHPDPEKQFILHTDASGFAVSGVLSQQQDDSTVRPLAYMSKKMNSAEGRYSTFDQELLAIVTCLDRWKAYLTGTRHPVKIYTDHHALRWIKSRKAPSSRQARWMELISEADFEVHHVPGKHNGAADALSRRVDHQGGEYRLSEEEAQWLEQQEAEQKRPVSRVEVGSGKADTESDGKRRRKAAVMVRLQGMLASSTPHVRLAAAESRVTSSLLDEMRAAAQKDEWYAGKLKEERPTDGLLRQDGLLHEPTGLVWVPADSELRSLLMREAHEHGGHHGVAKTVNRLAQMCWWAGMRAQVIDYVRGCEACARAKPSSLPPAGLLQPLPIPGRPWEVITLDFIGPLPETKRGHSALLNVGDKFSKMGHFVATTKHVTAEQTARLLLRHVVKHHGLPSAIVSDRDARFTSLLWKELWQGVGTELRMSSSYHPQTDGQTERLNRTMEAGLRLYCNGARNDWDEQLHLVEAYYNSAVHESTGKTPFEMNGTVWTDATTLALQSPTMAHVRNQRAEDIMSELKLVWAEARRSMMRAQDKQKLHADERRRDERYEVGDLVMLSLKHIGRKKGKLSDRWVGPFEVKELVGEHGLTVRLDLPPQYRRLARTVHVEKLKRFTPSQHDWPGRVQGQKRLPAVEQEGEEYEIERVIGKRITFEDVQDEDVHEATGEAKDDALPPPSLSLEVDQDEKEERAPQVDDVVDESVNKAVDDSKYDDDDEVKEREEPVRRVTRAATRAAEVRRREQRQVVSAHALRLRRAKGSTTTQGKEKRQVVWYLVQWKGYGDEHNSWVRAEDMKAPDAIAEYEEAQRRGDDLGVHYLHCRAIGETLARGEDKQTPVLSTAVVGDWA